MMTMDNPFHPKSNFDRLYIPRKEDGRGCKSLKEIKNLTNLGSENSMKEFRDCLLTLVKSADIDLIEPILLTAKEAKNQKKEEQTMSWKENVFHGWCVQQTKELGS